MNNMFKQSQFPNNLPQPLQIGAMREQVIQFPQVWKNILNHTAQKKPEKQEIINAFLHIMDDFKGKLLTTTTKDEELVVVEQLRMNIETLAKKNMNQKTQQLALVEPLDLTKYSNEKKKNELLETPNLSPIRDEMPTGASATTLTPRISQTLNRLVETPLQSQPQQRRSTQTKTKIAQIRAGKRALPAQSSPPAFNDGNANVDEQQQKKIKLMEIVPVDIDVIKKRLDERTIVVDGTEFVVIGANNTKVLKKFLLELNWNKTGAAITRQVLSHIFGHKTLATHTLTGRPSPAFLDMNKPGKGALNQLIVEDVIEFMPIVTNLQAGDVKSSITTKCADESKKLRQRLSRIAVAPSEANVTIQSEPMFAVSAGINVISVPEVTSSDSYERNVVMQPEVVSSNLTVRDVISGSEVTSSNSFERNVIIEPEGVSSEAAE